MSAEDTIRILQTRGNARSPRTRSGGAHPSASKPLNQVEWKRIAARVAWTRETFDRWCEAQEQMDDRCGEAVEWLSEEEFERLCDEEQAKVDAIRALLEDVIERDKWPKHLYFGGV